MRESVECRKLLVALILSLALLVPGRVAALEYHVDTAADNSVRFISDAPIEDFEGVTGRIDGYVLWQDSALVPGADYSGSAFYFEVPLDALDTGIDLRNSHMRENYLETNEFPYASFEGQIRAVEQDSSGVLSIVAAGRMLIHGVSREQEIRCQVAAEGSGYLVETSFPVSLKDHNIDIPSLMFMKINEVVQLELAFHLELAGDE